jgi:hypothetical protein
VGDFWEGVGESRFKIGGEILEPGVIVALCHL